MSEYVSVTSDKKKSTAFLWCLLFGYFGAHHFYVGRIGMGILYACPFGLLCIGWFADLFKIMNGRFKDNVGMPLRK